MVLQAKFRKMIFVSVRSSIILDAKLSNYFEWPKWDNLLINTAMHMYLNISAF